MILKTKKQKKLDEVQKLLSVFTKTPEPKTGKVKKGVIGAGIITAIGAALVSSRKKGVSE